MRFLRWLLRVDVPTPVRSTAEIEAEAAQNYRWNFLFNLLDNSSFAFGFSFINVSTILPLFIGKLTDNPLFIGLLAVIAQAGWLLPQLFTAHAVERLPRKKPVVVNLGLFLERLPYWVLALSPLLAVRSPRLALIVFFVSFAWLIFGAGIVATAWQDMIARMFTVQRRGRYFGTANFAGTLLAMVSAGIIAYLFEHVAFPVNFFIMFLLAALFIGLSWIFLAFVREPAQRSETPALSQRDYLRRLPLIIRHDHNFRNFLLARMVLGLGGIGSGFITIAALQRWQVGDATVAQYNFVLVIGQALGSLAFGFLADHIGHKFNFLFGILTGFVAYLIAWLIPDPQWYPLVFFLQGLSGSAFIVSGMMLVLEFCVPERRPTYIGLANTISGIVGFIAPMLGTALVGLGYGWVFASSACAYLLGGLLLLIWVREPRRVGVGVVPLA